MERLMGEGILMLQCHILNQWAGLLPDLVDL